MKEYTPDAKLFQERWNLPYNPFPFLGADEYREDQILSLFEIDRRTTIKAFSLQHSIVEGSYGTGKTMLLKAIYAFHYSRMLVDIAEQGKAKVIPIYIKFSDLPYMPENHYKEMILLIYKKILDTRNEVPSFLREKGWFDRFKFWLQRLTSSGLAEMDKRYAELSSDAVTRTLETNFGVEGGTGFKWLDSLRVAYENRYQKEILLKPNPSIRDIEQLFLENFSQICEKILLLIDEVDTLPAVVFEKQRGEKYSIYETFINQLRTSSFMIYKLAVYPQTESSNQVEGSRIGHRIKLGFNVKDKDDYMVARDFFYRISKSYLSFCAGKEVTPDTYFYIIYNKDRKVQIGTVKAVDDREYGDALEQLVFGSNGIVRRFIRLAGDAMLEKTAKHKDSNRVGKFDIYDVMRSFGKELIERLPEDYRLVVDRIATYCLETRAFRFKAPYNEKEILKYYDSTKQDNVLYSVLDPHRWGTNYIFEFDYCFCIYRNIPTHCYLNSEDINRSRSLVNGKWLIMPKKISESVIKGKSRGTIKKFFPEKGYGYVTYLTGKDLFFHKSAVVYLNNKKIQEGQEVTYRIGRNYEGECACDIKLV